ncbi:MAG: lipopolysaccharide heptosyltransferase II, partial [Candidatus Omnitrophica bacterium]|nr:lipopolysaccharide heptosyltransferase II [Candidatus Omnitrophota bacterium]
MKILFITLTNIGDVILTLPLLDALRCRYPDAKITVVSGPRAKEIFSGNPYIHKFIVFDKHAKARHKIKLFKELKNERFDLAVDLRNSIFGPLISLKSLFSIFRAIPKNKVHMKERHFHKLGINPKPETTNKSLYISPQDEAYINKILKDNNIAENDEIIVMSPGARSHIKKWPQDKFADLAGQLVKEFKCKIILVGNADDAAVTRYIKEHSAAGLLDLGGLTNLRELAFLLSKSKLLITNDSACLHLASYLDKPVVAVFGPTNELKYGPWSQRSLVVKKDIFCRPCEKAQCRYGNLKCMDIIKTNDVLRAVKNLLEKKPETQNQYKRILIARTDRIGDVVLSTPVIKALRDKFPSAYIAMMTSPYAKEIVEGNPYLDEVIVYDKDAKHKSWRRSVKFALNLKKKKFDAAVILHPTNRVHLVVFGAGIPTRIGYNRKLGFLLTDKLAHEKQMGKKHESEYNFDLLKCFSVDAKEKELFVPLDARSERWAEKLFESEGITEKNMALAVHPGASCPSKIWPHERFAEAADKLIEKYGFKVFIIAGPKDTALANSMAKKMHHAGINLSGKTSVSQTASLLKRCNLFISNDSGPVHIATAVGTPVISIFGRAQNGLSPKRWGPLGVKDKILHKNVGCLEC